MVEILEGVWTQPLEIEQSYAMVHKERAEALVLVIEEEGVPWYYDIMYIWMHDLPYLPCYILAPMALMHEHVNACSWHQSKATKDKP